MLIREETPADYAAIAEVNRLAFEGDVEAALIGQLRSSGTFIASLVALDEHGRVVGHILFSRVRLAGPAGADTPLASLAPMAVLPSLQRRGIGSLLVRRGIDSCRRAGETAIIVVGHPTYYPRFGFSAGLVAHLQNPYAGEAFMGLELTPGALSNLRGRVVYPAAFDTLS
jgi:putative acetyltransferase